MIHMVSDIANHRASGFRGLEMKMKELEIGKDYSGIFGIDKSKGGKAIYRGGDNWEMTNYEGSTQTFTNPKATEIAIKYINQPSISMGRQLG